jgi:hypothetical protein
MMARSSVGCGVVAELTAKDATVVVNQGGKRSIQEITTRQDDEVQTARRFIVSEEFADQALRPITPYGTTESTGRDDAQSTLFPSVRERDQRHVPTANTHPTMLYPHEIWPSPDAFQAREPTGDDLAHVTTPRRGPLVIPRPSNADAPWRADD